MANEGGGIGELFVELFFKADNIKLKDFITSVGSLNMSSILATLGLGAMFDALNKVMSVGEKAATPINQFSDLTGQSTEKMQAWNIQAEEMGASANLAGSTVNGLVQSIKRLQLTGEGSGGWMLLGIDPTKYSDYFELLKDVMGRLVGKTKEEQSLLLNQIGLSQEWLIPLSNAEKFQKGINEQLTIGKESLERMREFHASNVRLGHDLEIIWTNIASAIEPFVNKLANLADTIAKLTQGKSTWHAVANAVGGMIPNIPGVTLSSERAGGIKNFIEQSILTHGGLYPAPAGVGGNKTVQQTNNFNISSNDPDAVAKAVEKILLKDRSNALDQFGSVNY